MQAILSRLAPTPAKPKRSSGKGKAKGTSGRTIHQLRADIKRAASKEAKIKRVKQTKAKGEPKRPPNPRGPEPGG